MVDEMLGRLARYLRFVGQDAEYVRDLDDDEIVARSKSERRVLLTRDRRLARRVAPSLLLTQVHIADQFREMRSAYPDLPAQVTFERCSLCNQVLVGFRPEPGAAWPESVPDHVTREGKPVYRCPGCGHLYWEGSHTARIRAQLAAWASPGFR